MFDNQDDAMEAEVTYHQAQGEIEDHDQSMREFVADHGDHATYSGGTVLSWLGY